MNDRTSDAARTAVAAFADRHGRRPRLLVPAGPASPAGSPAGDDLRGQGPARLTVFTGSASGDSPVFAAAAAALARSLAEARIGIVYGGGRVGLMGVVADSALEAGGTVIGVIPQGLVDRELAHPGLSRLEVVADMHARKLRMAELGDGFVALPGGVGTLEELFEVWTWQQLGIHTKPVVLHDVDGYWQPLLHALDTMTARGFLSGRFRDGLIVVDDPAALLDAVRAWAPQPAKWDQGRADR